MAHFLFFRAMRWVLLLVALTSHQALLKRMTCNNIAHLTVMSYNVFFSPNKIFGISLCPWLLKYISNVPAHACWSCCVGKLKWICLSFRDTSRGDLCDSCVFLAFTSYVCCEVLSLSEKSWRYQIIQGPCNERINYVEAVMQMDLINCLPSPPWLLYLEGRCSLL